MNKTYPSGAYKDREDELRCRTCGQSCDIEDGMLTCPEHHFKEPSPTTPYKRYTVEIMAIGERPIKELEQYLHGFNIAGGSVEYKSEIEGYIDAEGNEVE